MAASLPTTPNPSTPSAVAGMWQTVWDNDLNAGASDVPAAINIYDAVGSLDERSSYRVVVAGTTRMGNADSDVETLAMHGTSGVPECYGIVNTNAASGPGSSRPDDYPIAISSTTQAVSGELTRQICITGGSIKKVSEGVFNTDILNLSYDGAFETELPPPTPFRDQHWVKPIAGYSWPAGDSLDVGVNVVVRSMDAYPPPNQFRGLFVIGRYVSPTLSDEWATFSIRPH